MPLSSSALAKIANLFLVKKCSGLFLFFFCLTLTAQDPRLYPILPVPALLLTVVL